MSKGNKTALITGITGQDGSYLAEILLDKGYHVHGIKRRTSSFNTERIDHLYQDPHEENVCFKLHYGDLTDTANLIRIIQEVQPDEIYNLAAQSHVKVSFETPEYTANADALGTLRILEAIRILGLERSCKFFQASTSEMFGNAETPFQNEQTPFKPRSPYAAAKLYAYWTTINYREAYGIFGANGILFNHESPRRGGTFVTRKVTRAAAAIHYGLQEHLYLGNLDSKRDWGHARDYMEGVCSIMQHDSPEDFVLASGETHTVRTLVEKTFIKIGYELVWKGRGEEEIGLDRKSGKTLIKIDPRYYRPTEVTALCGDASKAKTELGWKPKTSFDKLIAEMLASDLETIKPDTASVNPKQSSA